MERIGLAPGSEVGGYRIVAPLGAGGMGAVYRAVDGGGAQVALKLLHPHVGADPSARERLRREVAALQRLRHPGVAAVLDAEADSSEAFIVTELVDGENLARHVRQHGALDGPALADLARGLFEVLDAVHMAGVVHRDLKPGNVVLTADRPVLIDFGIAQGMDEAPLTSTGIVLGTPGYLAPELLDGAEPDDGSDWWGWAAVLAFAATGRDPFGARPLEAVLARARAGEVDVDGLGGRTADALRGALHPDPARRTTPDNVVASLAEVAATGDDHPDATVSGAVEVPLAATVPLAGATAGSGSGATAASPAATAPADEPRTQVLANDGHTRALPERTRAGDDGEPTTALSTASHDDARRSARRDDSPDFDDEPSPRGPAGSDDAAYDDTAYDDAKYDVAYDDAAYDDAAHREPNVPPGLPHDGDWPVDDGPAEPYAPPVPPRRVGSILLLGVLAVVAAALAPGVTAIAVAALTVLFGTVQSAAAALESRRSRRGGPRRGDVVRATLSWPWHLLRGTVLALPSILVGASVAIVVGGVAWWALDSRTVVVPTGIGGNEPWVYLCVLGVAMLAGLAALWGGPVSRPTRLGARRTLARLAPGRTGAAVIVTAAVVAVAVIVVMLATGQPTWWWPVPGPPSLA